MNEFVKRMGDNYSLFLYALSGRYQQLRSPGTSITPRAIKDLELSTQNLARTLYAVANSEVDAFLSELSLGASEGLQAGLAIRKVELLAQIRGILAENCHQVSHMARVGTDGLSKMLKAHGAMGMLVQQQAGVIKYLATDTAGRKWNAALLMKAIARDFAYQSEIDMAFELECDESDSGLVITNKGFVLALGVMDGYTSFSDARATIFHPNSNASFISYVPT